VEQHAVGEVGQVLLRHAVLAGRRQRIAVDASRVGLGADVAGVEGRAERLQRGPVGILELPIGLLEIVRRLDDPPLEELLVLTPLDQELAPLESPVGGDQELVHVHRLHDEVVRAELEARDRGLHVGGAGEDDDGRVRIGQPDLLEQLDAAHDWHLEIGDGQGRPRGAEHLEPLAPVVGEQTLVVGAEEDLVQDLADLPIVVDDEDVTPLHVSPPSRAARRP
jgi:hypothetical protein